MILSCASDKMKIMRSCEEKSKLLPNEASEEPIYLMIYAVNVGMEMWMALRDASSYGFVDMADEGRKSGDKVRFCYLNQT